MKCEGKNCWHLIVYTLYDMRVHNIRSLGLITSNRTDIEDIGGKIMRVQVSRTRTQIEKKPAKCTKYIPAAYGIHKTFVYTCYTRQTSRWLRVDSHTLSPARACICQGGGNSLPRWLIAPPQSSLRYTRTCTVHIYVYIHIIYYSHIVRFSHGLTTENCNYRRVGIYTNTRNDNNNNNNINTAPHRLSPWKT